MRSRSSIAAWSLALLLGGGLALPACGDGALALPDTGPALDTGPVCTTAAECDDGLRCTGAERCAPTEAGADARGCVAGTSPCGALETCEPVTGECVTDCLATRDADGDGARSMACGGLDCDDTDPDVFPGAAEVCDALDLDEDCDPATVGGRDGDADGFVDAACCNGALCGDDCDDGRPGVHPGEAEVCSGLDDDCDGTIDEGVLSTFYADADGDGHGDPTGETAEGCTAPDGFAAAADDCDDAVGSIHPGAYDACEAVAVDDDCSGTPNDPPAGCACEDGASRTCPLPGICASSTQTCVAGVWGACGLEPRPEVCANTLDDDCDGAVDDGCECDEAFRVCGTDVGACVRGAQSCSAAIGWGACVGEVGPAPETCNDVDDDCDGGIDEGVTVTCYADGDGDGFAWASAVATPQCGTSCPSGWTARVPAGVATADCDDGDARAFPGQTAFGTSARRSAGGFDFDCDGTVIAEDGPGCVTNAAGGCVAGETWNAGTADCGRLVAQEFCWAESAATGCEVVGGCSPSAGSGCGHRVGCR